MKTYNYSDITEEIINKGIIIPENLLKKGNTICVALNYNSPSLSNAEVQKETDKAVYLFNPNTKISSWFPKTALVYIHVDPHYSCGFWTLRLFFRKKLMVTNKTAFRVFY